MTQYSADFVTHFYDEYGDREWERLVATPEDLVKLYIHRFYLAKYLQAGMRVLEIGAGAGRFTQVLAELGCRVLVADISPGQLDLNRQHAEKEGFAHAVEDWRQLDICDLSALPDAGFDAVIGYGGPLSYVFERAGQAVAECARVLRPGGVLLVSVMSLWGTAHKALQGILNIPAEQNRNIIASGDISPGNFPGHAHYCHMFRSGELRDLLLQAGLDVLEMSASNCLSTNWNETLTQNHENLAQWDELLRVELEACCQPGCLDMGTHTLAIARKSDASQ